MKYERCFKCINYLQPFYKKSIVFPSISQNAMAFGVDFPFLLEHCESKRTPLGDGRNGQNDTYHNVYSTVKHVFGV